MSGLVGVRSVVVPRSAIDETHAHLAHMGRKGLEGLALWAGVHNGADFHVHHAVIPQQQGIRTPEGVCVAIAAPELHRLNVWLFRNKLRLIAQIHSHPTDAYHSDTDDEYAIATAVGCLSLVVPDFAAEPFSLPRCAIYRLSAAGRWEELTLQQVASLITIVE